MIPLERTDPTLYVFIPGEQVAICADCGGHFVAQLRRCPGCASAQFVIPRPKVKKARKLRSVS